MTTIKNARAYYSPLKETDVAKQREACESYAEERRWTLEEYEEGAIKGRDARADVIKDLRAEDEVALLYSLEVLRRWVRSATADFTSALARLSARSALVVDVSHDVDSSCADAWEKRVNEAILRVQKGRVVHPDAARAGGKASWHARQGVVAKWTSDEMAGQRKLYWSVWTNLDLTWEQARARMPDELQVMSYSSLRRIFDRQRPGKPGSPGRPNTKESP